MIRSSENLISIIMPMKNEERYISSCLESIVHQSLRHWELIIVDDHSTDQSLDVIERWSKIDERIQVISNNGTGISDALRAGYSRSTGSYIHRMDADDIMPANKLQDLFEIAKEDQVAAGLVEYFSDDGLGSGYQSFEKQMNKVLSQNLHSSYAFRECFLPSPAWMMPKFIFDDIGGFQIRMMPEDYDLYFRVLVNGYRIHPTRNVVHLWRDSPERISRNSETYTPLAFIPLKVHYFLEWKYDANQKLILWGAGKRGKLIAQSLINNKIDFRWISDNPKKWNIPIYGQSVLSSKAIDWNDRHQFIISISSPQDRIHLRQKLRTKNLMEGLDFWWFC